MSYDNFIPTFWANEVQRGLEKSLVYARVANRNYQGLFSQAGDTVKINQIGTVAVADYVKNSTSITPEVLDDASQTLTIDKAKYFAFKVDDVDAAQTSAGILQAGMAEAAYKLGDTLDQYLAGLYTQAGISGGSSNAALGTSATEIQIALSGATKPTEYLGRARRRLKSANVTGNLWMIVPPWFTQLLISEGISLAVSDVDGMLRTGEAGGKIQGFTLYESNNVSTDGTEYRVMGGNEMSITLAEQVSAVEAYRPEASFSDAIKGLHVYGAKVARPDATLVGVIKE